MVVLLVHGYHPGAEDGGIYEAGVYLRLHPALFPHDADFVRAPSTYSAFATVLALLTSIFSVDPAWTLFAAHLFTTAATLFAVQRIAQRCGYDRGEQFCAMALLCAWWTLPVAGTSLTIGDPYLTARSFSLPFTLCAILCALDRWRDADSRWRYRPMLLCCASLLVTAVAHRLMFGFALLFVIMLRATAARRSKVVIAVIVMCSLAVALGLSVASPAESSAFVDAQLSRQYWFLSEWRWYEFVGLAAPLLFFTWRLQERPSANRKLLLSSALLCGVLAIAVALLFAREGAERHLVARLQPLRMFMLLYVVMSVELGRLLCSTSRKISLQFPQGSRRYFSRVGTLAMLSAVAACMFFVQRQSFASSRHLELPWRQGGEPNPWVQAFVWCKYSTPVDALFALDPSYIHQHRNDAQTFRAHAWRSVLPDQSKDGGEAAVDAQLAQRWKAGIEAQTGVNTLSDAERVSRLKVQGVAWLLLNANAQTHFPCPFDNHVVKVCRMGSAD